MSVYYSLIRAEIVLSQLKDVSFDKSFRKSKKRFVAQTLIRRCQGILDSRFSNVTDHGLYAIRSRTLLIYIGAHVQYIPYPHLHIS